MGSPEELQDVSEDEVVQSYQTGASVRSIARATGWSRARVGRVLLRHGAPLRGTVPVAVPTDKGWWEERLRAGSSAKDLGRELGVSDMTVHRALRRHGLTTSTAPHTFDEWLRQRTREDGSCLRWLLQISSAGFPVTHWAGKPRSARRVVWELTNGVDLASTSEVLTTPDCVHTDCVAPTHLRVLSTRARLAEATAQHQFAHGEDHWNARLTEEDARVILTSNDPDTALSLRFEVSPSTVQSIRSRRRWTHLDD